MSGNSAIKKSAGKISEKKSSQSRKKVVENSPINGNVVDVNGKYIILFFKF